MENSLVSIIIPAYNAEKYISEAMESVLNSDYENIEVIVMDDGSTDRTKQIAETFHEKDARVSVFSQPNGGASSARNNAIELSKGLYILPVDADNRISENYVSQAVKVLQKNPEVKLVSSEAEFFGEKSGRWNFSPFSLNLLCRRNLVDNCAMYRKTDWKMAGGYCNQILGREDWDFWLSLFETGGEFVRLPIVGFYYRVRSDSKRVRTRHLNKQIIDYLNVRHKPLFYRELKGKLHYQRTHSRKINRLISIFKPHFVYANTKNKLLEKIVYLANDKNWKEKAVQLINADANLLNQIEIEEFTQTALQLPFALIKKSKAREKFNSQNQQHLGFYEEQASLTTLKSYLVVKKKKQ